MGIDDEEESTFTITTMDQKTFHFQGKSVSKLFLIPWFYPAASTLARDGEERQKWMEALEESISRASTPRVCLN